MSDAEFEARHGAMVEFLSACFDSASGPGRVPPADLSELSDGVLLFEVLSEIAPDHFDATSGVARDLGDNWALKSSNLRKLLRNLEQYYRDGLGKGADFESVDVPSIARRADRRAVACLVELVAGAAVCCEGRSEFVGRIMGMGTESQMRMKEVIERAMGRMTELDDMDDGDEEGSGGSIAFDSEDYESDDEGGGDRAVGGPPGRGSGVFFSPSAPASPGSADASSAVLLRENESLKRSLSEARRELDVHRSRSAVQVEDLESAQGKLRALTEDLQDRLGRRQDELAAAEAELTKLRRALEDAEARGADLEERSAQLADELDVASAKAAQLTKAEATVVAYRRKLEGVGVMSQQMNELEDQSASYLRQIMELESDVKKVPGLQRAVEELQEKLGRAEKDRADSDEVARARAAEAAKHKADAHAAEAARKMYEEELAELRARSDAGAAVAAPPDDGPVADGLTSAQTVADAKERALRLKIENDSLREQIEQLQQQQAASAASAAAAEESGDEASRLRADNDRMRAEIRTKEAEKAKLASDKEKLEAYTKKTLSKFQEKYLVALQECKAKLKEKHDKIEALEQRGANERAAQKREERLLSSTIYELGLAVMQQRLRGRE